MRRSLWIYISTAIGVLLIAFICRGGIGGVGENTIRYHQHLEQPSEAELGPCTVCDGEGALCSHLPLICIETGGQKIPGRPIPSPDGTVVDYVKGDNGETEIQVRVSTVEEVGVWHHPDDEPSQTVHALFRYRGNSSRWFDKGNYRLKLIQEGNVAQNEKHSLLGMTAGSEWSLHGPFLDKTLMRNYMWMNLSAEVMGYAPNVRFCELILDGEYQGVYVLMETIDVQPGRVDLTEYQEGDPMCSYLVRIEPNVNLAKAIDNFTFYTYRLEENGRVEILYPGTRYQNQQVKNYIQTDFNEIEKRLFSLEMIEGDASYRSFLDTDSFVDYYILQEFLAVNDVFSASTYFYRDVRGKLCIGPVWDYNNALDNFFLPMPDDEFLLSQRGWFSRLMLDESFVEQVIRRYRQLRQGVLAEEHLLEYTEQVETWLGSAIERNFTVWGYTFDAEQLSQRQRRRPETDSDATIADVNPASYEEAVEWMNDYMVERGRWLDRHIESLRQYCHPSKKALWTLG